MLSVRSCCSSSTTHDSPQKRRTSSAPDHICRFLFGYFPHIGEARWRRDGGETEARRRRAGGELEARRRRRRAGGETQTEVEARWQMQARDGGEMEARWRRDGGEMAAATRRGWRRRGWRERRGWLLTLIWSVLEGVITSQRSRYPTRLHFKDESPVLNTSTNKFKLTYHLPLYI